MQNRFLCVLLILVNSALMLGFQSNDTDNHVRYDSIELLASSYQRPFTALEPAAGNGDYSFYLATRHPSSVCIMIEGSEQYMPNLLKRCIQSRMQNLILLGGHACSIEIQRLGECEHFDLVFSFFAIERAGHLWKECIDGLLTLGDHLILEVPNKQYDAQAYLDTYGAQVIARLSQSNLYYIPCNKDTLKRKTWLRTLESAIKIHSTFTEKKLIKKTPYHENILTSNWKPGINLITFKMYYGIYPTKSTVKKALSEIKHVWHNDWAMHNMIIQGDLLALIDYGDPRMAGHDQSASHVREKTYQKILQCIALDNPHAVEAFFWKYLKTRPQAHGLKKLFKTIFRVGRH